MVKYEITFVKKKHGILSRRSKYFLYIYKEIGDHGLSKVNSKFCIDLRRVEEALPSPMPVRNNYYIILYYILKLINYKNCFR